MSLKYTNTEKTEATFNGASFTLAAPEDFNSIGNGPTREAVLAWLAAGNTPEPADVPLLSDIKKSLVAKIDDHMGMIFMRFQRFTEEYKNREASARAFIAGTAAEGADDSIVKFATAKGLTYAQACTVVVSQADGLRGAINPLGSLRMRKYEIDNAADEAAAQLIHDDIVAQANAIAAQL